MNRFILGLSGTIITLSPLYLWKLQIGGIPTNGLEILVLLAALFFLSSFRSQIRKTSAPRFVWVGMGMIFAGLILSAFSGDNLRSSFGIIKGWFIVPFIFFLILLLTVKSAAERRLLWHSIFAGGWWASLWSLWGYLHGQTTYDGRLKGFFLSPNHLAMLLAPALIAGSFLVLPRMRAWRHNPVKLLSVLTLGLFPIVAALFLTYSYAAWGALVLGTSLAVVSSSQLDRRRKICAVAAAFLIATLFFSLRPAQDKFHSIFNLDERSSLSSRLMIWKASWTIGQDHPWAGIGPGNFQTEYLAYQKFFPPYLEWAVPQPHNLILAFWLQSGILGIGGFLILIGLWLRAVLLSKGTPKSDLEKVALLAWVFYFLIHGLVDTPYWKNDLALLFWTVFALGINLVSAPGGTDAGQDD